MVVVRFSVCRQLHFVAADLDIWLVERINNGIEKVR